MHLLILQTSNTTSLTPHSQLMVWKMEAIRRELIHSPTSKSTNISIPYNRYSAFPSIKMEDLSTPSCVS